MAVVEIVLTEMTRITDSELENKERCASGSIGAFFRNSEKPRAAARGCVLGPTLGK
jgi:hypothetical protein